MRILETFRLAWVDCYAIGWFPPMKYCSLDILDILCAVCDVLFCSVVGCVCQASIWLAVLFIAGVCGSGSIRIHVVVGQYSPFNVYFEAS